MDFRAVDHTVNVVGYEKNGVKYVMTCAWSMMVDYDKVVSLLGSQSVTGKNVKKGDIVGFSALSINQKDTAIKLGEGHSDKMDKLSGIDYYIDKGAILINNSRNEIICEVIDVLHLEGIEEDYLLYLKVLSHKSNEEKFLHMEDL